VKTGLTRSIEYDLELIERSGKFTTSISVSGQERRIGSSKEIITYRIIQEALNNIIKHSKGSGIKIILNFDQKVLSVNISDNGRGFVKGGNDRDMENGAGLQNMQVRAQLIHGSLHIESRPEAGTTVFLNIPIEDSKKAMI
jgi:two-component system, NarL family, sensor kinase